MRPTDFMFEKYKSYGKEKWEIYAEVAREIYCGIGGFKKSDRTLRDSSRYDKSMRDGKYYETNSI